MLHELYCTPVEPALYGWLLGPFSAYVHSGKSYLPGVQADVTYAISAGVLPSAWQDVDATHMTAALAGLDPTYSGYLDWRELLLSLAAASIPAIHTATAAQVAAQAGVLADVDSDRDGHLTQQEYEGVTWWFEPKPEAVQAAQEAVTAAATAAATQKGCPGWTEGQQGAYTDGNHTEVSCQWAEDVLREANR